MFTFITGTATEKTAGPTVADLQKKIADMEAATHIRRKYGASLTDEQVAFYLNEERKVTAKQEMKAAAEARGRIEAEKRKKEIEVAAVKLIKDGRLIIAVNQHRVEVGKDLMAPCPHCGVGLVHSREPVFGYAEAWYTTPPDQRYGLYSGLIIYSAKNPLGAYMGAPLYMGPCVCQDCKKSCSVQVQLVVL